MPETDLILDTEHLDGVTVLRVAGDLDMSTVAMFDAELEPATAAGHVVVDLAACTFLDSSALRALVRAQKRLRAAGSELAIVAPWQPARRVLEIAAIDRFVPVFDTVDGAVTSLA